MTGASVLIPSLVGDERLMGLIESVLNSSSREVEVLIADNGLPSQTAKQLIAAGASVISMGSNRGFAAAVNRLATLAHAPLLAVLNDDISVEPGFLDKLLEPLDQGEAVSAGILVEEARPWVIETAGIVVDRFLGSYDHLHGEHVKALASSPSPPLGPCAGAAAFRRELFLALGGFDERFFAYYEDADLAIRMWLSGVPCALATAATARHAGSRTLGYRSLAKACQVGESRGALVAKYGLLRRPGSGIWVLGSELAACVELARRHRSLAPARARVSGYRHAQRMDRVHVDAPRSKAATVGLIEGLERRYRRSLRTAR